MPNRPPIYRPPALYRRPAAQNPRPSARRRGYSHGWEKFRAARLAAIADRQGAAAHSPGVPQCECGPDCCPQGCQLAGTHLDHVHAVSGPKDPTFFRGPFQALAPGCHARKTIKTDQRGYGRRRES